MIKEHSLEKDIDKFLTPKESAKILDISLSTLKKFIYQGRLKTFKTPGGHHRIKLSDLLLIADTSNIEVPAFVSLNKAVLELSDGLISVLEQRQRFCKGHSRNVAGLSVEIARSLKLGRNSIERVYLGALLHDIGKIGIEEAILNKRGELDKKEYSVIQSHPLIGERMIFFIKEIKPAADVIRQHHERVDGAGYPDGLTGSKILIESKIVSLAETFHSLIAWDSYKKPMSIPAAKDEISRCSGSQFDKEVVKAFSSLNYKP
ncbi:MAG: hypothetical protein DRP57_05015 [Spirochaetes bacterium]|nr:MAG: hypothetical protein DRP57_05015 [Spirochaetota bacterium]